MVIGQTRWSSPTRKDGSAAFTPSGPSKRRGRSRSRSRPTPPPVTSVSARNQIFSDFRAGKISRGDAIGKVVGASAKASFMARISSEEQRVEQLKRAAKTKASQTEALRKRLNLQNAQKKSIIIRDKLTGDDIRRNTLINIRTNERIIEETNLRTGKKIIKIYEKITNNGVRLTGMTTQLTQKPTVRGVKITTSPQYPGKKVVRFPSGKVGTIRATGRVVVGKNVAGKKYEFLNGVLVKINDIVIKTISERESRKDLTGRIIKDFADIVTTKTWNFIKKVNKKFTLKAPLTIKDKNRLSSELKKLESKKNLSKRDNRAKKDLVNILEKGEFKVLRGEVDLGGRAIAIKLLSKFPSYAKLFSKKYKDFGKVGSGNTIKEINTLQDFRKGQLAQAYLKAKNAQLGDKTIGSFVTVGGRASGRVLNVLNKKLRSININPKDVTLSRYVQSFKVPSNIPKTEALIKILKTGKMFTQKQLNKIPKFYDFKREGVLVSKRLKDGRVKVVAMEYNRVGNKISHISYKVGIGSDTFAVVSTFKKVRKLAKVKGLRVKPTGVSVVKSKIISSKQVTNEIKKTVSQMKTKKVFFNGKRLNSREINFFSDVLKSQSRLAINKNLNSVIANLYKRLPNFSISGLTNVVRVKRTLNKIIFSSGKSKGRTLGVSKKGDFLEVGFTKRRIASDRKLRVIAKAKITPSGIQLKPVDRLGKTKIDNTIRSIARGVSKSTQRLVQLEVKKGATKSQVTNVKNAVMSIQTIVRPVLRSSKAVMTKQKVGLVRLNVKKMLPGLSNKSKASLVVLTKSLSATQQLSKLAKTPVQKSVAKTIQGRILKGFSGLRPLTIKTFKKLYPAPTPKPRGFLRPRPAPKPIPKKQQIRLKLKLKKANTRKLAKPVMTYAFAVKKSGKWVRLKMPPMTLRDSFSAGSFVLDHQLQRSGKLIPLGKNKIVAKLGRDVFNYFEKHQKKFRRFRQKKGKRFTLYRTIIELNKYTKDLPSERRALQLARKRATAKRKPSPVKRKVASVVRTRGSAIIQRLKRQRAMMVKKLSVRNPTTRKQPVKRRLTPQQRRAMLLNLKRARAKRRKR